MFESSMITSGCTHKLASNVHAFLIKCTAEYNCQNVCYGVCEWSHLHISIYTGMQCDFLRSLKFTRLRWAIKYLILSWRYLKISLQQLETPSLVLNFYFSVGEIDTYSNNIAMQMRRHLLQSMTNGTIFISIALFLNRIDQWSRKSHKRGTWRRKI